MASVLELHDTPAPLWRRWWALTLIAAALAAGTWWQLRPAPPPPFVTAVATRSTITVTVTATGTLQPTDKVTVGAEVSGRVDDVLADFNDTVHAGQVIARLNTAELKARAVQARAGVAQGEANLAKSEHDLRRTKDLRARGYASVDALDQAQTANAVAKAALNSAQALAEQAEANLAKAEIRSPIDGVVLDRKVERGQTVAASFQTPELFVIASDLKRLELTVDIDEADIGELRLGQQATFAVDAFPQRHFDGELIELRNAARTVNNVVTYPGVLAVTNADGLLRPGMTATADIVARVARDVVTVPNRALRFAPETGGPPGMFRRFAPATPSRPLAVGEGKLWTVDTKGEPVARIVRLGVSDGQSTQILSGNVQVGEAFIVDRAESGAEVSGNRGEGSGGGGGVH